MRMPPRMARRPRLLTKYPHIFPPGPSEESGRWDYTKPSQKDVIVMMLESLNILAAAGDPEPRNHPHYK